MDQCLLQKQKIIQDASIHLFCASEKPFSGCFLWLGTVRTSVQGPGYMHGHGQPSGLGCRTVTIQWQPQGV